ncbi:MAG TPA: helix-hairpin-helix domain-containing protein, partial [Usitatibacteraceae bacterium]|nr:helix-hairpin-helix domain-containing protein [Usitatibacteraceae bacterium]
MKKLVALFAALVAYAGMAFAAVNINSATKEQLESLDGIGPVKAQAIVDYRKKNGPFKTLEDVKKVDGVGDATFDKIKKDIALSGTTTVPAAAAKADDKKPEPKKADAKKDEPKAKKEEPKKADAKKEEPKAKKEEPKKADAKKEEKKADAKKADKKDDKPAKK